MKPKFILKILVSAAAVLWLDNSNISYIVIFNKPCPILVERKHKSAFLASIRASGKTGLGLEAVFKPSVGGVVDVF